MALSFTLVPFQLSPTEEWTTAKFNQGFNPTISFTGSVATGDLASGAVTAAKVTPDAYAYAAASGTDTYTATFSPAFTAYINGLQVHVKFANANATTTPTLNANSLGAKKIRFRGDVALRAGDIPANCILALTYNTSLDGGSGGWEVQDVLENYSVAIGTFSNLQAVYATAATATITADELVLKTSAGVPYVASSVNVTVNMATSGANGLDTGAEASSTWYYLWVIYNPTSETVAGLLSTSATSPTLPSGYTYKALVGAVFNNGSSDFTPFMQMGKRVSIQNTNIFTAKTAAANNTYEILASGDLTAFRNAVAPIAVGCFGTFGTSNSAHNARVSIAAVNADGTLSSTTYGDVVLNIGTTSGTHNGFAASGYFEVPVRGGTSRNIQWACENMTNANRLNVSGYILP